MKRTLFIVADLHGHLQEVLAALLNAGWDENNPAHLLIVLGDSFDRGTESLGIFLWLYELTKKGKAIVLKGNHEPFFIDFLKGSNDTLNYLYNGIHATIDSFLEGPSSYDRFAFLKKQYLYTDEQIEKYYVVRELYERWAEDARNKILTAYPTLLGWLENLPYYYETEKYIFTHASIDTTAPDWHHPHCEVAGKYLDWDACIWDDGSFFGRSICNTDKTVVVGHFDVSEIRQRYNVKEGKLWDILTRKDNRIIMLDACTAATKIVNVLVVEDNLLD